MRCIGKGLLSSWALGYPSSEEGSQNVSTTLELFFKGEAETSLAITRESAISRCQGDVEEMSFTQRLSAYKSKTGGVGGNLHPGQGEESRTIR
jgi:hypothetical protein